ncbi:G1 family endopeptidase [Bradyrhizobium sp. SSUT18]|uniref:G1 family glutamic endopeptidase n=1 Tax=unclassified Bradyrhizobium TaxID=2631580 RepID=UPI00244C774A|nr:MULTISPECIES: G1 family glutamic endopeptidase [unclassified Bradyrhizobium]MDH2341093.1 G1 family endopeptidase [Bradyrhizobium sp. SSUT77]MDH2354367.1 G1 family endopeptidase [Bradyrhizobium sp. SSUT112]MDH2400436.1 G1 family endopeptidase [Bradyrhizobium sp. SSUT18]
MFENDRFALYEVVPPDFNLLDAPPATLDRYGIPQKPDVVTEPELFEFWTQLVSEPFSAKQPVFGSIDPPSLGGSLQSMLNWSGALISTPWPQRIVFAAAGWNVPDVRRPSASALDTHADDPKSLLWVGLDGRNGMLPNISLPQIGTGHWPNRKPKHFAWWDWWHNSPPDQATTKSSASPRPQAITLIENLPINEDDHILAGLAVQVSGDILYFIKNRSTGEFRSFLARQPPGEIEPLGSSVEWVMERPTDPESRDLFPLPDYDPVNFNYCVARAADAAVGSGRMMTLADNALMIEMRETFANPERTVIVSRAAPRQETPNGPVGVTCTFQDPLT